MNRIILLTIIFINWVILSGCTMVISSQPPQTAATLAAMEQISVPYASTILPTQVPATNTPTVTASPTSSQSEATPTLEQNIISPSPTITPTQTSISITPTLTITPQESITSSTVTPTALDSTPTPTVPITPTEIASAVSTTGEGPTVYETALTIDTFDYEPALIPTTPEDLVYPYPRMDHNRVGPPSPKNYKAIVLENRYLQLTILPDLGGRIYRWIDKASGKNLFYENPVIKPTTWGNRGWWLATGGMEWALPLDEHGLSEASPWAYQLIQQVHPLRQLSGS